MPFVLEDLEVYKLSENLGEKVWSIVMKWESFTKFGLGKQLTASADSISANIAEGYGRYFLKENINFCFYARGSLLETKTWIRKARTRQLIKEDEYLLLVNEMELIHKKLNGYVKVLRQNINKQ
ncbi:MAG: four helix bundle protein [Bacteroidota bacterium]